MPYTFLCYARKDEQFALSLAQALKDRDVPMWVDQWDIPFGANWDRTIENALYECTHFLIILSPAAVESNEVQAELHTALDERKQIIPVLYQPCRVPRQLRVIQHTDFTSRAPDDATAIARLLPILREERLQNEPIEIPPSVDACISSTIETQTQPTSLSDQNITTSTESVEGVMAPDGTAEVDEFPLPQLGFPESEEQPPSASTKPTLISEGTEIVADPGPQVGSERGSRLASPVFSQDQAAKPSTVSSGASSHDVPPIANFPAPNKTLDSKKISLIICGFAIGGAIGFAIGGVIDNNIGFLFGFAIGGAISGLTTALVLKQIEPSVQRSQIVIVTIAWAIGFAIGGVIGNAIGFLFGFAIGGAIGFAIGGLTTALVLKQIEPSVQRSQIVIVTIVWAISGVIGGVIGSTIGLAIEFLFGFAMGGAISNAIGFAIALAIGFAIGGAIGGMFMLRYLHILMEPS